jgi:hypothetical protein
MLRAMERSKERKTAGCTLHKLSVSREHEPRGCGQWHTNKFSFGPQPAKRSYAGNTTCRCRSRDLGPAIKSGADRDEMGRADRATTLSPSPRNSTSKTRRRISRPGVTALIALSTQQQGICRSHGGRNYRPDQGSFMSLSKTPPQRPASCCSPRQR